MCERSILAGTLHNWHRAGCWHSVAATAIIADPVGFGHAGPFEVNMPEQQIPDGSCTHVCMLTGTAAVLS